MYGYPCQTSDSSQTIEEYKSSDYSVLGSRLCESIFDFASLQRAVERIAWLSKGRLKLEKQTELARIVAQGITRRLIRQARTNGSGVTALVESIRQRLRGRSFSPLGGGVDNLGVKAYVTARESLKLKSPERKRSNATSRVRTTSMNAPRPGELESSTDRETTRLDVDTTQGSASHQTATHARFDNSDVLEVLFSMCDFWCRRC